MHYAVNFSMSFSTSAAEAGALAGRLRGGQFASGVGPCTYSPFRFAAVVHRSWLREWCSVQKPTWSRWALRLMSRQLHVACPKGNQKPATLDSPLKQFFLRCQCEWCKDSVWRHDGFTTTRPDSLKKIDFKLLFWPQMSLRVYHCVVFVAIISIFFDFIYDQVLLFSFLVYFMPPRTQTKTPTFTIQKFLHMPTQYPTSYAIEQKKIMPKRVANRRIVFWI